MIFFKLTLDCVFRKQTNKIPYTPLFNSMLLTESKLNSAKQS